MTKPIFLALGAALLFGAAAPFGKILLGSFSAFQLAGILYLGAALGVAILLSIRRESFGLGRNLNRKNGMRLGFAVLFGGILAPLLLLKGLQAASAGSVSLWLVWEMVLTAVLGQLFFKDPLGRWGWVGAMGCLSGSVLLSLGVGPAGFKAGAWVVLACLCWGLDNQLTSLIDGLKPLQSTFWKGLCAGSVNFSAGFFAASFHPAALSVVGGLVLGALSYGVSIALYIRSAQVLGATRSQMVFSSAPFIGLLLAFFLLGENPTWIHGMASLLFFGSLFLLFHDRHSHAHTHEIMEHLHGHRHDDGHHNHLHPGHPPSLNHSHPHVHESLQHSHPHWPDLHHRHGHGD